MWTADYLKAVAGAAMVEVMWGRDAAPVAQQNIAPALRREMPFGAFVDIVYSGRRTNDYYLVSRNRFFSAPELRRLLADIRSPDIVRLDENGESVRLWFGPGGTYSPLHYDDINQLFVQVVGRKRIRFHAPCFSGLMRQVLPWYADTDPGALAHPINIELEPGDAVFIPVAWWHLVEAEDVSMSITFRDFGILNDFQ
jgi:hypothetical protein